LAVAALAVTLSAASVFLALAIADDSPDLAFTSAAVLEVTASDSTLHAVLISASLLDLLVVLHVASAVVAVFVAKVAFATAPSAVLVAAVDVVTAVLAVFSAF
jgi:hypothetical protein